MVAKIIVVVNMQFIINVNNLVQLPEEMNGEPMVCMGNIL
jgi:hypothetical protein